MSKDEILELYLNLIFLGGRTYGVEVASQYYFSKSASDLTLAESAFLAGINNAPNMYSPFSTEEDDIKQIKTRTKIVLDKMYELNLNYFKELSMYILAGKQKLEQASLYPLKKQADLSTAILKERLEVVLPWAMEESGMKLHRMLCDNLSLVH